MSAGAVFRHALLLINQTSMQSEVRTLCTKVLDKSQKKSPAQLLYQAGCDAHLDRELLLTRTASLFMLFSSLDLLDDLMDGDCDYIDQPAVFGPCVQLLLQSIAWQTLSLSVNATNLCKAQHHLARAAHSQLLDVIHKGKPWTASLYQEVCNGIAGDQFAAYLTALWSETHLEEQAETIGRALGNVGSTALDDSSDDPRFHSLSAIDKEEVTRWVSIFQATLDQSSLTCCRLLPKPSSLGASEP